MKQLLISMEIEVFEEFIHIRHLPNIGIALVCRGSFLFAISSLALISKILFRILKYIVGDK
jgi:hypothetical protein